LGKITIQGKKFYEGGKRKESIITTDYRCESRKKFGELGAITLVPLERSCLHLSEKPRSSSQKTEPFSWEMHLKISLSSRGLRLSNS
jgi:hypothetical protein